MNAKTRSILSRTARVIGLLLVITFGCGRVEVVDSSPDAGNAGTGGAADLGTVANGGASGQHDSTGVAGVGGQAGVSDGGPELGTGPSCIGGDAGAVGFAYNAGCDGGTTLPTSCHAGCTLNGEQFVGCAWDDRVASGYVVCHASCGECP